MDLNLRNKTALVCGSTQGIGKGIAMELASLGANLVLMARNEDSLKVTLKELANDGSQVHGYVVADFSKAQEVKEAIDKYLDSNESPEILVNNTGGPAPGVLIEEEYEKFEKTFSAHIECNHTLAKALVPGMKAKGYGRIINVISSSVYTPIPGLGVSNTTRGAVASWAKTLSIELGQFGITVNNVLPGLIDTGRLQSLVGSRAEGAGVSKGQMADLMQKDIPMGRFGTTSEIGAVAAFLASPAASYVSGVSIPVDGGKMSCI